MDHTIGVMVNLYSILLWSILNKYHLSMVLNFGKIIDLYHSIKTYEQNSTSIRSIIHLWYL